ncbi:MAG: polysaccharide export protein [Gammaproteobacteria bacterium]|nr:polysaccharide export protein [Gammaproteobacteria bacterium]
MNRREAYTCPLCDLLSGAYLLFTLLVLVLPSSQLLADNLERYRLGPDDILSITVFGEPELSLKNTRVATNGRISFPLLGQIPVEGLTVTELEAELIRRLADGYLRRPRVIVAITEYRLVYVNGEVKQPGGYSYRVGLTVHKAVTLAGGFTERASPKKITLIRENEGDKPQNVDLSDHLRPGDIITVGESFF